MLNEPGIAHELELRYRGGRLPKWLDALPAGPLHAIYLHWSGGDYRTLSDHYHICVALDDADAVAIHLTHDLQANLRDVRPPATESYAAHTFGRNSFAAGLAVMGMRGATPSDFGAYPLRVEMLDALCAVVRRLCERYELPADATHVMTHAEAALADGYFGCADDERWDIARLAPSPRPLTARDAREAGDQLRAWIRR
ncbi:MAG: N-acetylmuramoyl-L-alanine amidase [Vulcanimicrobiaceae bacterium]